jgi:hypothetical protein
MPSESLRRTVFDCGDVPDAGSSGGKKPTMGMRNKLASASDRQVNEMFPSIIAALAHLVMNRVANSRQRSSGPRAEFSMDRTAPVERDQAMTSRREVAPPAAHFPDSLVRPRQIFSSVK